MFIHQQLFRWCRVGRTARVAGLAVALCVPVALSAWGDHGHRMIGLTAAQALPQDMPRFFRDAAPQLSYLNPEPDRWKDRVVRELEPAIEDSVCAAGVAPQKMGLLPFTILELTAKLRGDFRL